MKPLYRVIDDHLSLSQMLGTCGATQVQLILLMVLDQMFKIEPQVPSKVKVA